MPFEPKLRFLKIIWRVISFFLGGGCSIQLSYGDTYEILSGVLPQRCPLPVLPKGGRTILLGYWGRRAGEIPVSYFTLFAPGCQSCLEHIP